MNTNMGSADRLIRILIAIVLVFLYLTDRIVGTLGIIGLVVAAVFLLTGVLGWCPGYVPLGISTCKRAPGSSGT